ncbi:MAG: hypothetical protein B0D92_01910 [Spirochaeta sp. LUC14_002_19_P3]|nr:MAG: hypothetical protein B0D92_01910 [Spirochaeta sp. LUC14_002_19_P3]
MTDNASREVLDIFAEGRELYKQKNFALALEKFKGVLALNPEDGPSQVFCTRCEHYMEAPPSEGWDGVFEMKTK